VTLESLIAAGYDPHLTAFDVLLPALLRAYDQLPAADPKRLRIKEPIEVLRGWDRRSAMDSVPTALAILWGQALIERNGAQAKQAELPVYDYLVEHLTDPERLDALNAAIDGLQRDFGGWRIAWGEINRFQRRTDDIVQPFDDEAPSLPVGFAPGEWGALASFDSIKPRHTKKIYGSSGNSFVAAVEFGPIVRAKAIMSGGESGDPASPHFKDQAQMFVAGEFRDVLFTPEDVQKHAQRRYHPGQ
jgi:acyl-homoserine-lactone acylase